MDEILLIDKPDHMTSFGVVARVRRILTAEAKRKNPAQKRVKVGHTGTLDPFATGLLIILTGKQTKNADQFLKLEKEYIAALKLGFTSTTGDPEGEISPNSTKSQKIPTKIEVLTALEAFLGPSTQRPPIYSAIKIDGQRAYRLAREGKKIEMPERKIEVYELELLNYSYPELKIRTKVSSGTYIRTLAEDIGEKLGTGAYLTALRRTQVGKYRIEDAERLEDWMTRRDTDNAID